MLLIYMNKYILIVLIILLLIIYRYKFTTQIENASFLLDHLAIPQNPETINELQARQFYAVPGIDKHAKIDKNGRVEHVTYQKPEPESGEKGCYVIDCPPWVTNIVCWKCL